MLSPSSDNREEERMAQAMNDTVRDLVNCQHPGPGRIYEGQRAKWCGRCGAFYDGETWERPELAEPLKDALRASERKAHE